MTLEIPDDGIERGPGSDPSLEFFQRRQWEIVRADRDLAEISGAMTSFGPVDSDSNSQIKLVGAVVAAQARYASGDTDFTIAWTMADNTSVDLTMMELTQMGAEVAQHINNVHQHGRAKREAIFAATTREELNDIGWEPYPAP